MKAQATLAEAMKRAKAKPDKPGVAPSRRGKKAVVLYVEPDMAKQLKILAAENDTSVHALGLQALDLLFQHHRPR